jgi:hypothetical protein
MLSIGLRRWYINIAVTILNITHWFKTQLNSIGLSLPHRRLIMSRYEPNRLMLSFYVLWRWYINITITILDIIHCTVFYLKTRHFGDSILSPSSAGTYSRGPIERPSLCLRPETYPISAPRCVDYLTHIYFISTAFRLASVVTHGRHLISSKCQLLSIQRR